MITAYVIIETEKGHGEAVARLVAEMGGVTDADAVLGRYDVIAVAQAADADELSRVVAEISSVERVTRTMTCCVTGQA